MDKLSAKDVAEYFVSLVDEDEGDLMSNLKLQKLLYYSQGFHLALFGLKLFPEPIEAWSLGPVVKSVYNHYKEHGGDPIHFAPDEFDLDKFDAQTGEFLDEIFGVYGQYSASALVRFTHEEPPWKETPTRGEITPESMKRYFKTQLTDESN